MRISTAPVLALALLAGKTLAQAAVNVTLYIQPTDTESNPPPSLTYQTLANGQGDGFGMS